MKKLLVLLALIVTIDTFAQNTFLRDVDSSRYKSAYAANKSRDSLGLLIDANSTAITNSSATSTQSLSNKTLIAPTIGTSGTASSSHIKTAGTIPTVSMTGAGTGGSVGVALETGSTDQAGTITITTGNTSVGSTGTVTLTFANAYTGNTPVMLLTLVKVATDWGALATARVTTQSLSAPVITWNNSSTGAAVALTTGTTYKISYQVIGK